MAVPKKKRPRKTKGPVIDGWRVRGGVAYKPGPDEEGLENWRREGDDLEAPDTNHVVSDEAEE